MIGGGGSSLETAVLWQLEHRKVLSIYVSPRVVTFNHRNLTLGDTKGLRYFTLESRVCTDLKHLFFGQNTRRVLLAAGVSVAPLSLSICVVVTARPKK